jgi:hypothetical protein
MRVYPHGSSAPNAVALDFVKGAPHSATYITKVGSGRRITVHIYGKADETVDLVGYFGHGSSSTGRLGTLRPSTILNASTSGHRTLTLPARVPAGATSVLLSVTVHNPSTRGTLRAYAAGTSEPTAIAASWGSHRDVTNFVIARIGTGRKVTFHVTKGSARLKVQLLGYATG